MVVETRLELLDISRIIGVHGLKSGRGYYILWLLASSKYPISKKMGGIRCFAVEMARRGRSGGTTNLRCLVRPRRLETRTQRGFPHFHSNGGYCSLAHLKRQNPPKSRGPPDSRAEPKNQRVYCHLSGLLAIGNLKIPGLAIARHASFITAHPIVREFTWRTGAELAI